MGGSGRGLWSADVSFYISSLFVNFFFPPLDVGFLCAMVIN